MQKLKMYISYLPDSPTLALELVGYRFSVNVVSVVLEDSIIGRGKLLATTAVYKHISFPKH